MSLRERLVDDLKRAMKSRDSLRVETIRSARGAVRNLEIDVGTSLDDGGIARVIRTLVKQREDSAEQYAAGGRPELTLIALFPGFRSLHKIHSARRYRKVGD